MTLPIHNWNYSPQKEAKKNSTDSQRYYLFTLAQYMPHLTPLFGLVIDKLEQNAAHNRFKGWKAMAHEWALFINACCTPEDSDCHSYQKEREAWIGAMNMWEFAIHHRALMLSSLMMDGADFDSARKDWTWLWSKHPEVNRFFDFGISYTKPELLCDEEEGAYLSIDDQLFVDCADSLSQLIPGPVVVENRSDWEN